MNQELETIASIVIDLYGKKYGVTREMLSKKNRKQEISYSRFFIFSIAKKTTKIGLRAMGNYFNIQEHNSVLNGIKRIENFCASYPQEKNMFEDMLFECRLSLNKETDRNIVILKMHDKIVNNIVKRFEAKHDLIFDYWIRDQVGETAVFGDYSFNFTDILFDFRTKQKPGDILKWHNENVEHEVFINYNSYCMGLRHKDLKI